MPIEFSPPSLNMQGFQIPSPQSVDPLQTLAQMGQLRTQGLQQQTAQLGLDKTRMELNSNKALLKAMVDAGTQGTADEIFQRTYQNAAQSGQVLPEHLISLGEHHTKMQQDAATLDKTKLENLGTNIDRVRGLYDGVTDDASLAEAHAKMDQLGVPKNIPRYPGAFDATHLQAFSNGLALQSQHIKEAQEKATTAASKATQAKEEALTTEAGQKIEAGEKAAVAQELQAAPVDPQTGTPTPAAVAEIQARHPKVILSPDISTKAGFRRFVRSTVPTDKQPEYDINNMKADVGLLGNSEFDQYQLRYAQSIGKKPNELNFPEMQRLLQLYAKDKQDPNLLALILGQKGLQNQLTQAQVASIPGTADIDSMARQLVNGDMSPEDLKLYRSRYGNAATQALRRAEEIVKAEGNPMFPGKPFSIANLQTALETRELTEKKFADGPQADMVRSFDNLMQHTALLDDARKAMSSNDVPALKSIANIMGVASGGTAQTTYDTIADFVASEAGKAFQPAGGGEADRAKTYSHFERNLGNDQISKNITALMHLADSQRAGLERQYERGTFGKGLQTGKLFAPESLTARDRLMGRKPAAPAGGQRTGKITVLAGDGSLHAFDTEEQAKTFEKVVKAAGGTTTRQ